MLYMYYTDKPYLHIMKKNNAMYGGGEVVRSSLAQSLNDRQPDSNKQADKVVMPDKRDKKRLIPVELDITRTKEFWEKAVWS